MNFSSRLRMPLLAIVRLGFIARIAPREPRTPTVTSIQPVFRSALQSN
jgi:hypothetical protein